MRPSRNEVEAIESRGRGCVILCHGGACFRRGRTERISSLDLVICKWEPGSPQRSSWNLFGIFLELEVLGFCTVSLLGWARPPCVQVRREISTKEQEQAR